MRVATAAFAADSTRTELSQEEELTAAAALRLPNVVVLAGELFSPPGRWGINPTYWPLNLPRAHVRREAGSPPLAAYYAHLLQAPLEPDETLPLPAEALQAEAAAGVRDAADVALVVPWLRLRALQSLFPRLAFRRFESAHDCWSSSVHVGESFHLCVAQTRYRRLVDATDDDELWALSEAGGAAWPSDAAAPDPQLTVDVLVHAARCTPAAVLVAALSRRGWAGRSGPHGDWLHCGTQIEARRPAPPVVAVASSSHMPFAGLQLDSCRIPLRDEQHDHAFPPAALKAQAAAALVALEPARWLLAPPPAVAVLTRATAAEVEADVAPHDWVVLPVAPGRVLDWLTRGDVTAGRVALVDARGCETATLRMPAGGERLRYRCLESSDEQFSRLVQEGVGRAEIVGFYCNHASSSSPSRAKAYAAWARSKLASPPQRVFVVAGGGAGLVREARRRKMDLDALFTSYESPW